MPTITRENLGLLNDKLTVLVTKEDYLPNFEKSLKNYSKNANLPGFRKGMVPPGLIKKMYGQSAFADEVLKSVEKSLFDYIETEKLEIFAQPMASEENDIRQLDCNKPGEYSFSFEIGIKPEVVTADLTKAKLTRHKVEVTAEMIEEEVERLQNRFGTMSEPELVDNEENVLNITLTASDENGNSLEGAVGKENSLLVKYFTKKYRKQLMGAKKDDSFTFKLNDAFEKKELEWVLQDLGLDSRNADAADAWYTMQIVKLGFVTKKELGEELYLQVFPNAEIATEEAFREALKTDIENQWNVQSTNQLQDSIYHYLVDNSAIEFPETFLKKWMQTGREKPSTAEAVEAEYPKFVQSLKWTLISDKLSRDNDLKVGQEDIKNFAKVQVMGYMGLKALDESHGWVDEYANKMMSDKKFVEDTYHRVITEKLFDWATSQVKTTEKTVSAKDFAAMQHHHEH